jgi:hypothetical protein
MRLSVPGTGFTPLRHGYDVIRCREALSLVRNRSRRTPSTRFAPHAPHDIGGACSSRSLPRMRSIRPQVDAMIGRDPGSGSGMTLSGIGMILDRLESYDGLAKRPDYRLGLGGRFPRITASPADRRGAGGLQVMEGRRLEVGGLGIQSFEHVSCHSKLLR